MMYTPEPNCYTCVHSVGTLLEGYKKWSLICTLENKECKNPCDKYMREIGSDDQGRGD